MSAHHRRQPACGWAGRAGSARITPRRAGTTASIAPSQSRSGCGRRGAGTRPWADRPHVREEFPNDGGIVQRGDQPQPTPTMRARKNINRERPVHERRPAPGARTALCLSASLGPGAGWKVNAPPSASVNTPSSTRVW